jgi:hypothetical protein
MQFVRAGIAIVEIVTSQKQVVSVEVESLAKFAVLRSITNRHTGPSGARIQPQLGRQHRVKWEEVGIEEFGLN